MVYALRLASKVCIDLSSKHCEALAYIYFYEAHQYLNLDITVLNGTTGNPLASVPVKETWLNNLGYMFVGGYPRIIQVILFLDGIFVDL